MRIAGKYIPVAMAMGIAIVLLPERVIAADAPAPGRSVDWYTGAESQVVDDSWTVALDTAATVTSNSSAFGSVSLTTAVGAPATQSGVRLRAEGTLGTYSYAGREVASRVTGYQEEGALMTGYEWVWRDAALSGFIGLNVRSNQLSIADPGNPVVGTGVGLKVAGNFYATPTDRTMVSAYGSYSTKFNAYYSRIRAGYMIADGVYLGPEALALGDDFFGQYRVGAHLSGVTFGPVQLSLAAGYVKDRVQGAGYYTSIDARTRF